MRAVWSFVLLLVAKLATLSVPFTFKWAIDALTGADTAPVQSSNWALWLIASPLIMTLSYGAVRVLMAVLTQWRDGIFAKVAMHAVRKLAYRTFVHMHELSLRFHLERKDRRPDARAGARPPRHRGHRADGDPAAGPDHRRGHADHGRAAVAVRLALCAGHHDHRVVYMYYTYIATEWRIEIRRRMNDSDTEANTKAIDSLLNYETVKFFSAELREATRYDRSMERYERASVKTYTSLALLNTGQAIIFTAGSLPPC